MNLELKVASVSVKTNGASNSIIQKLSLEIKQGETVAIVGAERGGKSTLLMLLGGLLKPSSGNFIVDNVDWWDDSQFRAARRSEIGFGFQFPDQQFFCETVRDELLYAPRILSQSLGCLSDWCPQVLHEVGLSSKMLGRSPFSLSFGESRRLSFAITMMTDPKVYLLDEPTVGLDETGLEMLNRWLLDLQQKSKTIVMVTRESELLTSCLARKISLERGQIVADDKQISIG